MLVGAKDLYVTSDQLSGFGSDFLGLVGVVHS